MNGQESTGTNRREADLLRPPISLARFIQQMGITTITAWRWRRDGKLHTVNICGRQYVTAEEIAKFNARVTSGEFAREHKTPNPRRVGDTPRPRRGRPITRRPRQAA